jgi:hypothetical protein
MPRRRGKLKRQSWRRFPQAEGNLESKPSASEPNRFGKQRVVATAKSWIIGCALKQKSSRLAKVSRKAMIMR